MDALLLVAALLFARILIEFFRQLSVQEWASQFVRFTAPLAPRLGFADITSPYHGVFDVSTAVTFLAALVAEWVVALVRRGVR